MVFYRIGVLMYRLLCVVVNLIWSSLDWIWFICNFCSVLIPWLLISLVMLCITSRFIRLRDTPEELVTKHLYRDADDAQKYPVANQGAYLDAPENSISAIKMVSKYYNIDTIRPAGIAIYLTGSLCFTVLEVPVSIDFAELGGISR